MTRIFQRRTILIAVFESRAALSETVESLTAHEQRDILDLGHAALVSCAGDGSTLIQNNNVTAIEGTLSGGMIGAALMGLGILQLGGLTLPALSAALAVGLGILLGGGLGSLIGYFVAARTGFGFQSDLFDSITCQLRPGQVALVLQVRPAYVSALQQVLPAAEEHLHHS